MQLLKEFDARWTKKAGMRRNKGMGEVGGRRKEEEGEVTSQTSAKRMQLLNEFDGREGGRRRNKGGRKREPE
jgi:hypothetical protein